ncbi:FliI/YscN family ATPase [Vibrio aquimaris]|uniref:protein-secreting ATPase n=1 Tax=Vibrio aquimaris TaxID=2587862 RepID=A0A5P9CND0_9VIBR|nr:FliI/YscN family ATPase [Vibrio aquimaris]QFT27734.1 putative ATP synthase YscN [Vibrio aquimaris]
MSQYKQPPFGEFDISSKLNHLHERLSVPVNFQKAGKVVGVTGNMIKALMPSAAIGHMCYLKTPGQPVLYAEVIAIQSPYTLLAPLGEARGLSNLTRIINTRKQHEIEVGDHLLGTVLNGLGERFPSTAFSSVSSTKDTQKTMRAVFQGAPDPMTRPPISSHISLGVRAIDSMLTMGEGQRMGIFAAAGGGKSTLLSMIIANTEAEVVVLALVGERGREVREFIEMHMDEETRKKAVLVIATSDRPSMERARAALVATTVAEHFREKGKKVLLMVDSLTRYARALREMGLSAGEPPTRRGFPPSVFEQLPLLLERPGITEQGSISALYTVLVEGDDMTEPVADETRSILDGHIILSRELAAAAHYPAIDVLRSASRVMNQITSEDHLASANKIRKWMATYEKNEMLVRLGEYQKGSDPDLDIAIAKRPQIQTLLQQGTHEFSDFSESLQQLELTGLG